MAWQLQIAKQRFSELVRLAIAQGPQFVTRHGKEAVVVLSVEDYRRLTVGGDDFKVFLFDGPDLSRLDIRRDGKAARKRL
jgi:prevent-host-death family protein